MSALECGGFFARRHRFINFQAVVVEYTETALQLAVGCSQLEVARLLLIDGEAGK